MNMFINRLEKLDNFNLRNSISRKILHSLNLSTDIKDLNNEYDWIEKVGKIGSPEIKHILSGFQDIEGTISRLGRNEVLDDIQLYEIKHFSILTTQLRSHGIDWLEDLAEIIKILDPGNEGVDTFYIYDLYDERLIKARRAFSKTQDHEQYAIVDEIENNVRKKLSGELKVYTEKLRTTLVEIGLLDFRIAKWDMIVSEKLVRPILNKDGNTEYKNLFNIELRKIKGSNYQNINIGFGNFPTLITGMNMGGKTVLLKSLAISQLLCQYGFFVPAEDAIINVVDDIVLCMEDEQNFENGISSFASEMLKIKDIITSIERGEKKFNSY